MKRIFYGTVMNNNLKHGLLAKKLALMPNESRYQVRKLRKTLWGEYQPANQMEAVLVEHMVFSYRRLSRALVFEDKILRGLEQSWQRYGDPDNQVSPLNFVNFDKLELFARYLGSIQRAIFRTQAELTKLKTLNKGGIVGENGSKALDTDRTA